MRLRKIHPQTRITKLLFVNILMWQFLSVTVVTDREREKSGKESKKTDSF